MERFLIARSQESSTSEVTVIPSTFFTGQRRLLTDSKIWFFLRISFVVISKERFDELFELWSIDGYEGCNQPEAVVWAYEIATKKERAHVHLVGQFLDSLIEYIKDREPNFKGNQNYSFGRCKWDSQVQFEHTIQYIVKDGNYHQRVFEKDWIDKIANLSFKKTQHGKFNDELEKLRNMYLTNKLDDQGVFDCILELKADYNQSINEKQIKDRVTAWKCKKDPNFRRLLASAYSETFNFSR